MKKILIYVFSLILLSALIILNIFKEQTYLKNMFYMDTYISVEVTSRNKAKALKAIDEIENIFKKYDSITNRYDTNSEIYKINNKVGTFEISHELYDILKYSIDFYSNSNGLFNINMGSVIDVWKKYRDSSIGIPTKEELNKDTNINNIKLLSNNKVYVNNANIDLGAIVKGYVTNLCKEYLSDKKINKYIINAGGNVVVGKKNPYYKIGIEDADNTSNIIDVVNKNNVCVVTSGGYRRFYTYNGKKYHHIIDPNTNFPTEYMKSVTIISSGCTLADALSTTLFLMDIESGKEFIKKYDVDVIWYSNDNEVIRSFNE